MRISLDGDHWLLEEIDDVHWFMLMQLTQAADMNQSEKGRKRLLPDVADPEEEEVNADWREYIQPGLETQFTNDLETVSKDLDTAYEEENDDGKPLHFLEVPIAHAETWYSVLNQARLIINEEYNISETEKKLYMGEQTPSQIEEKKWLVMVQYRVYAIIQEFLLTNIMEPGYEG